MKEPSMGTTVKLADGTEVTVEHATPAIDETCDHDWVGEDGNPEYCKKCNLSFTRYIFSCCP